MSKKSHSKGLGNFNVYGGKQIRAKAMNDYPLVSIGMPVYNGEPYIRKALDSLLAQSYEHFELIISDNASVDETMRICHEYAERDPRIRIHRQSHNMGIQKNFLTVLELAQGKYFMWAGVDDYWLPEFVKTLVDELESHPEAAVAMTAVDRVLKDGSLFDTINFLNAQNPNNKSRLGMALGLCSSLKYNLFIYGLFPTNLIKSAVPFPIVESGDRWFLIQFALASKFRYLDRVLHVRMQHHKPYQYRYPDDEFVRKKKLFEKRWFDFESVFEVYRILSRSKIIPRHRKLFIPIILVGLYRRGIGIGIKKIVKAFIVRFFPLPVQMRLLKGARMRGEYSDVDDA
jgi:glycosyltransferase involved in cell wall biosynthesis